MWFSPLRSWAFSPLSNDPLGIQALYIRLHGGPATEVPEQLHKYLDLVAVGTIADLEPRVLASGHGVPMTGVEVARDLHSFARRFSPEHPA